MCLSLFIFTLSQYLLHFCCFLFTRDCLMFFETKIEMFFYYGCSDVDNDFWQTHHFHQFLTTILCSNLSFCFLFFVCRSHLLTDFVIFLLIFYGHIREFSADQFSYQLMSELEHALNFHIKIVLEYENIS